MSAVGDARKRIVLACVACDKWHTVAGIGPRSRCGCGAGLWEQIWGDAR